MSFRQFPAIDENGTEHIIVEFRDDPTADTKAATDAHVRYELDDGRHLIREGHVFRTSGGELTLSV